VIPRVEKTVKTVRFAEVVAHSGQPALHTPWLDPAKDPNFRRAIKDERVMTVHEENVGARKDYGAVGFHPKGHAQYLIFPKSLKRFAQARVVGVKFELVAGAGAGPAQKTPRARRRTSARALRP
jgi:hypothetical protein